MTGARCCLAHPSQIWSRLTTGSQRVGTVAGMEDSDRLPRLDFDEGSAPREHQFELFHDTVAPLFDTLPVGPVSSFAARATDYRVGDLFVSRILHNAQTLRRTPRHIAAGNSGTIAIQLWLAGNLGGAAGDGALEFDRDHVGILDMGRPFSALTTPTEAIWVVVPRSRLTHVPTGVAAAVRLHRRSPRGRVLASAVSDLWSQLPDARVADSARLADGFVEVLESVFAPGDFVPSDAGLSPAIRQLIDERLDDLDLDADALRRIFHCSRSTLYRLFEEEGGVARYLRGRRLQRCFDELTAPEVAGGTIAEVATRWGFENPSHFNRVFKGRFGVAPSLVVRRSVEMPVVERDLRMTAQIDEFHRWASLA